MLKNYQFKTHCKGDSHAYVYKIVFQFKCIHGC